MSLSYVQVYSLARGVGLPHEAAITATAIADAESNLNPAAVGDVSLTDATWGPSVGIWQIRSLKADTGSGRARDAARLKDPHFNARAMATISNGGKNFGPWSTYNDGAYQAYLNVIRSLVTGEPQAPVPHNSTQPADWEIPGVPDDLLGGLWGGVTDGLNPVPEIEAALMTGLILSAVLGLGVTLIAVGVWRTVS